MPLAAYEATERELTEEELESLTAAERLAVLSPAEVEILKEISEGGSGGESSEEPEGDEDEDLEFRPGAAFNEQAAIDGVKRFFARINEKEDIDYTKPYLNAAFADALKTLTADDANAQRNAQWFLREAHNKVTAELGLAQEPAEADAGDLPSEEIIDGRESEFTVIDKLEGIELEDALAALPVAKQERYLRRDE
jgi:hypothetical protein